MNKNIKIFSTLLILIVAVGAVYFFSTRKDNTPAPVQTVDQTGNWKTYTNEFYGYSFKYPSDWFLKPMTVSGKGDRDNLNSFDMKQFVGKNLTMTDNRVGIEVGFVGNRKTNIPINEWFNTPEGNTVLQLTSPDYTMVGGEQAVVGLDGPKGGSRVYYVANDLNVYTIWLNGESSSENFKTATKILSTFKFLDSSNNTTGNTDNYDKAVKILQAVPEIQIIENAVIKNGRNTSFSSAGGKNGDIVTVLLFEGGFPDKHTTRIDTFMVNVKTNEIQVFDATSVSNKNLSLEEWKKTVKTRFQ